MTKRREKYRTPPRRRLRNRQFYRRKLWKPARLEHEESIQSRRGWLDALTLLYDHHELLLRHDGTPFEVPDVDDLFEDPDMRWMSNFLASSPCGTQPKHYSRKYERLEVIYLYCLLRADEDDADEDEE